MNKSEAIEMARSILMSREPDDFEGEGGGRIFHSDEIVTAICPECNRSLSCTVNTVPPVCWCGWNEGMIVAWAEVA